MCDELYAYTLAHGSREFIHQYVVDAYAAQHVGADTKPIAMAAALIGLFLFCERGYTGRQVQQAHMKLGNKMKTWPLFEAPAEHSGLTVTKPLSVAPGAERDETIKRWARAVWEMWRERHLEVENLLNQIWDGPGS
jgi:Family of unknown function (DUF5946)